MAYAGQLVTSDLFMPSSWTSYDDDFSWTAATANPDIDNGSIQARYIRLGPVVWYRGKIAMGSGTTYGTGEWRLSLPVEADATITNCAHGAAWLRDGGTPGDYVGVPIVGASTYLIIRPGASSFGGSSVVDGANPFAWGSGDWLTWSVTYEVA